MDEVGHQAMAGCVEAEAVAVHVEEFQVRTAVVFNEENILVRLWRIAALNNVVRLTRNDDSRHARPRYKTPASKNIGMVSPDY